LAGGVNPRTIKTEHGVGLIWAAWRDKRQGREALAVRQTSRLVDMIAYARARSPVYR